MQEQYIKLSDLRKVSGIGEKTIQRIKEALLDGNKYTSEYNPNCHLDINNLYHGNCLELMSGIRDKSIDMILCDLPYGTTACKWDSVIPFKPLWVQYERIIKDNGAIVLFGSQPFTSALIMSNPKLFRYEVVWKKERPTNFMMAKKQIMKYHENILIFYKNQPKFHPQMRKRKEENKRKNKPRGLENQVWDIEDTGRYKNRVLSGTNDYIYPNSILEFNMERGLHPTQKPVALFEYLIKTYTNEDDIVLDNCIGSGTTAIAAINTNRQFIGFELDDNYYKLAKNRVNQHIMDNNLQDIYPLIA